MTRRINKIIMVSLTFSFDLNEWCRQYQLSDSDTGKYRSVWRHIMTFNTEKTITSDLKVSTYFITSITHCPIDHATILLIINVSTFQISRCTIYTQSKKLSTPMFFWNDKWYDKYHEITDQTIWRTQWWPVRTLHWL